MKASELNREQLLQLKQRYLIDWYDTLPVPSSPSWQELADADTIVDDELVLDYFEGIEFVPEDFTSN